MNLLNDITKTLTEALGTKLVGDLDAYATAIHIDQRRMMIEMTYDYHIVGRWARDFIEMQKGFSEYVYRFYVADTGSCRFEVNEGDKEICVSFM